MTVQEQSTSAAIEPRLLLGPGPSPVARRVREALAQPTVGHLDPSFLALMDDVNERLRHVFGTTNATTFPVSATGSAGMEASLANILEPGDVAIVGICGVFGARLAEMARRMSADVVTVESDWGRPLDPQRVIDTLQANPGARALALVHAETSTGVWQPLAEIGAAVRETETLLVVDTVTSLGGVPVEADRVGIDVAYSGTQKCLGVPPGLAPITFSPRALERIRTRQRPCQSWYLDVSLISGYLGRERRYHHTAPINLVYALREGLVMIQEEGLAARYARHLEVGRTLQAELEARDFELFAEEGYRLPQLTSARLPGGVDEAPPRKALLERFGIEVGGGLGPVTGRIWRIGLMGSGATHQNVDRFLDAVDTLREEGGW
jgi:alanine-glyoxylate transaminase/serine-glyoxylate transaminase/serine-pyruvate transaminase